MALTDEKFEKLERMLEALEPELGQIVGSSKGFIDDQIKRLGQYGRSMFMSDKQYAWVESVYEKYVGPLRHIPLSSRGARDDTLGDNDVDEGDDIPF